MSPAQKIAAITGANRGLGRAYALRLAAESRSRWDRTTFHFLLNNASTDLTAAFADLVNVHLKGVLFLTQTLSPATRPRHSAAASTRSPPGATATDFGGDHGGQRFP